MRIVVFNWRDTRHPLSGGAEAYTHHVAQAWAAKGHDVTIFASHVEGAPATELIDGVRVVRRGSRLSVYREAERWYRRQPEADLVIDEINTRPFLCARWNIGAPVVALMHQLADDVWLHEFPRPVAVVGRHYLEPRWLRAYRRVPVLTISRSSEASLRARGLTNVAVVPVGDPDPPAERRPKESRPTAIVLGRLARNKRPDHTLAAFRLARERVPGAQLWIVGSGEMEAALHAVASPDVSFFGRVDEATKYDLLGRAHVLLATSVREGWGMNVSEAAAVGTRTIGYDVAGLRDSIPASHGVLTAPDPSSLGDAISDHLPVWANEDAPSLPTGTVPWSEVAEAILHQVDSLMLAPNPGA